LAQSGYGQGKVDNVLARVPFIPISGLQGFNLFGQKAAEMPWYNGFNVKNTTPDGKDVDVAGVTLYDALDKYVQIPRRDADKPFRMPVSDVLNIKGVGDVITGRIEQGTVKKGDILTFVPADNSGKVTGKVFSIEMHHRTVDVAGPGDNIGINVKQLTSKVFKGDVAIPAAEKKTAAMRFTCQVAVQDHPGQLKKGFNPIIFVRTGKAAYRIAAINWKVGKSTNKVKVENPELVEYRDQAEIVFESTGKNAKQLFMETYSDCEGLGRVVIMDSNSLVMLGKVVAVEYAAAKDEPSSASSSSAGAKAKAKAAPAKPADT